MTYFCQKYPERCGWVWYESPSGSNSLEVTDKMTAIMGLSTSCRNDGNIADIRAAVRRDRRMNVHKLPDVNISYSSVKSIPSEELCMRRVCQVWVRDVCLLLLWAFFDQIRQPPYSPDLAPRDFFPFSKNQALFSLDDILRHSRSRRECIKAVSGILIKCFALDGENYRRRLNSELVCVVVFSL